MFNHLIVTLQMRKSNEAAGMPVPASVEAGTLLSWCTLAKVHKSLSRSKKMDDNCCRSEKNSYLCDALHLIQATRFANFKPLAFFVLSDYDIVPTPVRSVNAPAACIRCRATGKRYFFCTLPVFINHTLFHFKSSTKMRTKKLISWRTLARMYKSMSWGLLDKVTVEDAKGYTKYLLLLISAVAIGGLMEGGVL